MLGKATSIATFADDALWETQHMTTMINSPNANVAALLFISEDGQRQRVEISGQMISAFG